MKINYPEINIRAFLEFQDYTRSSGELSIKYFDGESNNNLHKLHEICYFYEEEYYRISTKWVQNREMNNSDFIFTSIMFNHLIQVIQIVFGDTTNKPDCLINFKYIDSIISESISIEKNNETFNFYNWFMNKESYIILFEKIGWNFDETKGEKSDEGLYFLKNLRNNLIHINNMRDSRNIYFANSYMNNERSKKYYVFLMHKIFDNKNSSRFEIKKDIFLKTITRLLKLIHNQCNE